MERLKMFVCGKAGKFRAKLLNKSGGEELSWLVIIAIVCVLGVLLLTSLYAITKDQVIPSISEKLSELFNYGG